MLPRQVLPRQFYLITRRCSRREFLLRPDPATNNAFLYCLIDAALRYEIDVLLPCVMSNHYHAVIYDRAGRYPEFIEHVHKLVARSQNALRGRWGEHVVERADLRGKAGGPGGGDGQAGVHGDQPGRGPPGRAGSPLAGRKRTDGASVRAPLACKGGRRCCAGARSMSVESRVRA